VQPMRIWPTLVSPTLRPARAQARQPAAVSQSPFPPDACASTTEAARLPDAWPPAPHRLTPPASPAWAPCQRSPDASCQPHPAGAAARGQLARNLRLVSPRTARGQQVAGPADAGTQRASGRPPTSPGGLCSGEFLHFFLPNPILLCS